MDRFLIETPHREQDCLNLIQLLHARLSCAARPASSKLRNSMPRCCSDTQGMMVHATQQRCRFDSAGAGAGSGLGERPKTFIWAAFRNRIFSIGSWAGRQLGQT